MEFQYTYMCLYYHNVKLWIAAYLLYALFGDLDFFTIITSVLNNFFYKKNCYVTLLYGMYIDSHKLGRNFR